jgi:hypothetical protein
VLRERRSFKPGDRERLKPDVALVQLFEPAAGKRLGG